ncbi:hypothetical protein FOA52_005398 [Chlamydomonas sp. UWO 241]|nr:hypothetical protein FOA52_005398 [Chlamydomonas sp. UWO 241]
MAPMAQPKTKVMAQPKAKMQPAKAQPAKAQPAQTQTKAQPKAPPAQAQAKASGPAMDKKAAGQAMHRAQMEVAGARERAKIVKAVVEKVVQQHFKGRATVQLQGTNTAKSDVDLFVRMDPNLPDVTRTERAQIAADIERGLLAQGVHTTVRLAENIVQIHPASAASGISKTDIIFERYKGVAKLPDEPNKGMSALAAQVVRHLKGLRTTYSNLPPATAGHYLETYVDNTMNTLQCQGGLGGKDMTGAGGFARLVAAALAGMAPNAQLTKKQEVALRAAGVRGSAEWEQVAARELKKTNIR